MNNLDLIDLQGEEWKDILGYEGKYQISNYGRVKSFFNGPIVKKIGILKQRVVREGYVRYGLSIKSKVKHIFAHRLVAMHFLLNPNNLPQINHKDCNKLNNFIENLEWCSAQENIKHSVNNGLQSAKTPEHKHKKKVIKRIDTKIVKDFLGRRIMINEVWTSCKFSNLYEISSFGRIRSKGRYVPSKNNSLRYSKSTIIAPRIGNSGHLNINLYLDTGSESKHFYIHRLVADHFLENPDNLPIVHHKNHLPYDNHIDNLEWVDQSKNTKYAIDFYGHKILGENCHLSVLKEYQVIEMRRLFDFKIKNITELSDMFSVSIQTARSVVRRRTWKFI